MPRESHTQVRQWPLGDQVATTVHHIDDNGDESIEFSGIFDRVELQLEETARGHEMALPELHHMPPPRKVRRWFPWSRR